MQNKNLFKEILEETRYIWDRPGTRASVRKEFAAVLACGTPALGWRVYASNTEERRCYGRCKSRSCASCGYRATLEWLEEQGAALPDIPYSGVVFTMPSELWPSFRRNRHLLYDLPHLGAGVLQQWLSMKYGAKALIMVFPHTFGGDLKFNTHLHILVSRGGLDQSTSLWIANLELNKRALVRMWRYAVIEHLRRAQQACVLRSDLNVEALRRLLSSAYSNERHREWIGWFDKIVSKAHFLAYSARYVRRPPIANWRILSVIDGNVEFVAKERRSEKEVRTRCTIDRFTRLIASHVPDWYRHGIRYFGLLSPRTKNLHYAGMFLLLGQTRRPCPKRLSWRELLKTSFGFDPMIDSSGKEMHWIQ
jgi:hypothetical protein